MYNDKVIVCQQCKCESTVYEISYPDKNFRCFKCKNTLMCKPFLIHKRLLIPNKLQYKHPFTNTKYDNVSY